MMRLNRQKHWDSAYTAKSVEQLGWYKPHLDVSLRLIRKTGIGKDARVMDIGGGASTLADDLLDAEFEDVTVLDVSEAAIRAARSRLGARADRVSWIVADVTTASLPACAYDLWHDRAVFHFLTSAEDRNLYRQQLRHTLAPAGQVVLATFSLSGPRKCSGLEVVRYSPESLRSELGKDDFDLAESEEELHQTPSGVDQRYIYCRLIRRARS